MRTLLKVKIDENNKEKGTVTAVLIVQSHVFSFEFRKLFIIDLNLTDFSYGPKTSETKVQAASDRSQ